MRVVAGKHRGRRVIAPTGRFTRPTTDRLRETIFNILQNDDLVTGARVLDVFAGSGALGLEALSRGADFACFIDQNSKALSAISSNVEIFGEGDQCRVLKRDATRPGKPKDKPFDLVFLDPPYGKAFLVPAILALTQMGWLEQNCHLLTEMAKTETPPEAQGFDLLEDREYGESRIALYRWNGSVTAEGLSTEEDSQPKWRGAF